MTHCVAHKLRTNGRQRGRTGADGTGRSDRRREFRIGWIRMPSDGTYYLLRRVRHGDNMSVVPEGPNDLAWGCAGGLATGARQGPPDHLHAPASNCPLRRL
jgi:hypothetical protein